MADTWRVGLEYGLPEDPEPASLDVPAMALDQAELRSLEEALRSWLAQSLGALALDTLTYATDLASDPGQHLRIELGPREDLITAVGGLGCLVEVAYNKLRATIVFATDVTSLQLLADDLKRVLGASSV
jgi:hypothetical protein